MVLDFQDIAWYLSSVYFRNPEVQSFFSRHEHFQYSQLPVENFADEMMMAGKLKTRGKN